MRQQGHHRLGGGEIARREQDLTRSLVKRGLVLAADTRTNAGVDHIATVRKLALFGLAALYSKRGA